MCIEGLVPDGHNEQHQVAISATTVFTH